MKNNDSYKDSKGDEENLWENILKEASRSVADRLESKHVLLVGDRNSGKSTLLARLQGLDIAELERSLALDYSYIDIHSSPETDDDPVARINVWQLEGEPEHKDLLKFAINDKTIGNSLILISVDFSQPWNIVESLNRWLEIVKRHVVSITDNMSPEEVQELKNYHIYDFQQYTEPSGQNHGPTPMKQLKKKKTVEEQQLLPLSEGVLTNNIGVPIIVVCSKSDTTTQLEKEYGFKESHFDFIQQYLRRICISYGAALIYTSAKKERNVDVLLQYLRHKLYGFDFNHKMQLVEKDIIFMPAGADSFTKINVDFENQNLTKDPDEPYEEIIRLPKRLQRSAAVVVPLVTAEDDQEFLSKHKEAIEKEPDVKSTDKSRTALPEILDKIKQPSPTIIEKETIATPKVAIPASLPPSTTTGVTPDKEHQVLAEFFNSLINKDRAPNATGGGRKSASELAKGLNMSIPPRNPNAAPNNREDVAKQLESIKRRYQKET